MLRIINLSIHNILWKLKKKNSYMFFILNVCNNSMHFLKGMRIYAFGHAYIHWWLLRWYYTVQAATHTQKNISEWQNVQTQNLNILIFKRKSIIFFTHAKVRKYKHTTRSKMSRYQVYFKKNFEYFCIFYCTFEMEFWLFWIKLILLQLNIWKC